MVWPMETKKLIGAAAFTVALAGGGVAGALLGVPGVSGAQDAGTSTTTADDEAHAGGFGFAVHHERGGPHLDAAAEALGMTADELRAELEDGSTIADVAAEKGVDVNTVIDAIVAAVTEDVREHVTDLVNGELPEPPDGPGFGFGHRGGFAFHAGLDTAAEAIGITEDELRAGLEDGQTIAEVAEANGVDVQTVIDALVAEATARIDEEVAEGDLDQETADEIKADLAEHLTDFVNHDGPRFERHVRGPRP
jgi:uncharacterized protein YidB (DUF937 family)